MSNRRGFQVQLRLVVAVAVLACFAGCDGTEETSSSRPSTGHHGLDRGGLASGEWAMAVAVAEDEQSKVTGTFVGATAFATRGTPSDRDSACDTDKRLLNIRLVWEADASFVHGGMADRPDGPRKSLLLTVDPATGDVCETGAQYWDVGATPHETLLYGDWPDPADG
jgi:hypothetical protein